MSPRAHYFLSGLAGAALSYDLYVSEKYGFICGFALLVVLLTHLVEVTYHRATRLKYLAFAVFVITASFQYTYTLSGWTESWDATFWYVARGIPFLVIVLLPIVPPEEAEGEQAEIGL